MQKSGRFTFTMESDLLLRLGDFQPGDKSELYRRAMRYVERYRTCAQRVDELFSAFCKEHPEVLSGKPYDASVRWNDELYNTLRDILTCAGSAKAKHKKYRSASHFLDSVPEDYSMPAQCLRSTDESVSTQPPKPYAGAAIQATSHQAVPAAVSSAHPASNGVVSHVGG